MTWKKTWFSYVLWGCYLLIAGGFAVISLESKGAQYGITGVFALLLAMTPFLAGALFSAIVRLCYHNKKKNIFPANIWPVLEGLVFAGLLAAGLLLRIGGFPAQMEGNVYYDLAQVTGDSQLPDLAHGAVQLYVLLLRGVLLFMGNQWEAGVILQLVLQFGAGVFLYCGVRKLAGGFPALWTFGFIMLVPFSIHSAYAYGPEMLYLLLYSLGFCLLAVCLKGYWRGGMGRWHGRLGAILLGIYLGCLIHLDVLGVSLLLFCAGFFGLIFSGEASERHKKTGGTLAILILAGAGAGLAGLFASEILKGEGVLESLDAWEQLFMPRNWPFQNVAETLQAAGQADLISNLLLVFGLSVGGISFWIGRKQSSQSVFYPVLLSSLFLTYICRAGESVSRLFPFYLWLIASAGCGVREIFADKVKAQPEVRMAEQQAEGTEEGSVPEKAPEMEERRPAVKFIENPLPLPKKHVKKTMGYGCHIPPEKLHYDVEVDPDDDFPLA